MSDLFGNHIVGFPTRWLIYVYYQELTHSQTPVIETFAYVGCSIRSINSMPTSFSDSAMAPKIKLAVEFAQQPGQLS